MIAGLAQPKQRSDERLDTSGRSVQRVPDRNNVSPAAGPPSSHLQAVHASKDGVILRGMRHETFWEWHT